MSLSAFWCRAERCFGEGTAPPWKPAGTTTTSSPSLGEWPLNVTKLKSLGTRGGAQGYLGLVKKSVRTVICKLVWSQCRLVLFLRLGLCVESAANGFPLPGHLQLLGHEIFIFHTEQNVHTPFR